MFRILSLFTLLFLVSCSSTPENKDFLKPALYSNASPETVKEAVTDMGRRFGSLKMTLEKKIGKENLTYFVLTSSLASMKDHDILFRGRPQDKYKNVVARITKELTFAKLDEIINFRMDGDNKGSFMVDNECMKARFLFEKSGNTLTRLAISKRGSNNIEEGLSIVPN